MLNGDCNENSNKIITSNEHKNKFARAAHFSVHFFMEELSYVLTKNLVTCVPVRL